ncbi:substrate-binding domain-containing protein [Modestobacter sp. L9-4]|uniref:substrate-binding domain-containing protein n=1 Tax=Modestobacter sp. L9-4 TaxID=2851567 RepID=UPI001C740413|nr:substrate-binding domain-containing protein [Modestobacter sp. L9-4]QXG74672.1 substrate-binding domain-containing protein [Modestobacter sp. L9-4]
MGRHAHTRARSDRRRPALLAGLAAIVAAVVVAGLVWWTSGDRSAPPAADAAACTDRRTVPVTVAPELEQLAGQLLDQPLDLGGGACAVAEVTATEPLQTLADLGALGADAQPEVWVPDSSLWAARAGDSRLQAAGSMATSPLVLATSRAAAEQLGWTATPPSWGEALTTDRPLAVPDLAASAEGVSVLAAVRQSLGGGDDADNAVVEAVLAAGRGDVPTVADALAAGTAGGADAPLVPVSEQEVLAANQAAGSDALVAVYPREGSPSLDYPVLRLPVDDDLQRRAVDAVVQALTADTVGEQARAAGFRDQQGGSPLGAGTGTGVQEAAPQPVELDAAAVQALLGRLSSLATPSRLLTVMDVSTSMEAPAGDGTRATLERDAGKSALSLLPDSHSGGVWAFAHRLDGDRDWVELAPLRTFGADAGDGKTQRQLIDEQFDTLPDRLSPGGTGLYDTTLAAVRAARDAYDPNAVNTVVLITDGEDDDDEAAIDLPALLDTLRSEADPARPVKVVGIALGPDADLGALQRIGDATGGAAYPCLDPEDLQGVLFDAIRRRS